MSEEYAVVLNSHQERVATVIECTIFDRNLVISKKQKCEKTKGRVVNFALLAGLSSTDMLVGTNFCPPLQLDNELSCEKVNDDQKAAKDATDESTEKDVAVKEAEKSVLKDEGLKWHRHMIKP